jgi:hypothetical protein
MSDALWGAVGAVVGASITVVGTYVAQRRSQLMADCRSAVKALKRFRRLDDIWAQELSSLKPGSTPERERRRVHTLLEKETGETIGQYGEPARIERLLDRLQ